MALKLSRIDRRTHGRAGAVLAVVAAKPDGSAAPRTPERSSGPMLWRDQRTLQRGDERVGGTGHMLPGLAQQEFAARDGVTVEVLARIVVRPQHPAREVNAGENAARS